MNKEKATIYDLWRMCKHYKDCTKCPLGGRVGYSCSVKPLNMDADKINEIILNRCKEHPVKTRQDKFLEMFPNAEMRNGCIEICPNVTDRTIECERATTGCNDCQKSYWLAEVEENE